MTLFRTNGSSAQWVFGPTGRRTNVLSDQWVVGPSISPRVGKGIRPKNFAKSTCGTTNQHMNETLSITMPDRPSPELTTTANGTVGQQGAVGDYVTVGRRRKRGGKHVRLKQKRRMGRKMEVYSRSERKCGHYDWQRERVGRYDGEEEGRYNGDKVEGKQGQEYRIWLQIIQPWRGWEEKWSRSYTEGRLHQECVGGEESVKQTGVHEAWYRRSDADWSAHMPHK